MFEKEAEDNKPPYAFCALDTKCELWKDGFQRGAEFGYNKAKEEMQAQDYSLFDFVMQYENGKFKCKYKSGKEFESVDGETWKEIVDLKAQIEKMKCCGNCTKGNCVNIGQKGKACAYWTSNELRR